MKAQSLEEPLYAFQLINTFFDSINKRKLKVKASFLPYNPLALGLAAIMKKKER